jgi:hypothetical protein
LVGRERELSLLLGALGGDARLLLVVEDAGVRKTRFAGEVMTRAAAAGMVMVRGECLPLASALPLLPVAAALDELDRLGWRQAARGCAEGCSAVCGGGRAAAAAAGHAITRSARAHSVKELTCRRIARGRGRLAM